MAESDNTCFLVNVGSAKAPNVYAKISPEDAPRVLMYKWSLTKGKFRAGTWYVRGIDRTQKPPKQIKLHRLITNAPEGVDVDHINGDGLDNRRENLRFATARQNIANSRKHRSASSRYKGVSWHGYANKWRAYIVIGRKQQNLGLFEDEMDAARAYDQRATVLFGEFARLNLA